jgi:hypothetical protein
VKRTSRPIVTVVMAAAGILGLVSMLSAAGPQSPQLKRIESPVHALAPGLLQKLTSPTSREVILESIKALQIPSAPLSQAARPANPPIKMQMRQGPGKGKPAAINAAGAVLIAGVSTGYEKIDWKAGVFISPFTVPKYGTGNWPAAMIKTNYINYMKTQDPGIVVMDWPLTSYASYSLYDTIQVYLELPQEAGLYTITLKAARSDGLCDARWVGLPTKCGSRALSVHLSGQDVPMTKLIDDSGFVGVINIEPGEPRDGSAFGMRHYNAWLSVDVTTWGNVPDEFIPKVGPLVFAGIVITRL